LLNVAGMSEILLGTCGWSYADWENNLYHTKQGKLKQYSSIFPTVKIDSTFYALPKPEIVLGWVRHSPSDFLFSAKLPQTITHKKALNTTQGIEQDLEQFLEVMEPLTDAGKLECILVQLPPFLKFDVNKLESFLELLPDSPTFAVEFRHDSWLQTETFNLLKKHKAAYTIIDEPLLPPDIHVTSEIAYVRWHGRGSKPWFNYKYSEKELQDWVPKVKETSGKSKKVLGYFNNHFHGYAPENCLQMMQMLGVMQPHGSPALQRLTMNRKTAAKASSLDAWTGSSGGKALDQALSRFTDQDILEAADSIPDKDLSLREDSKQRLAAYIGDTTVEIDFKQNTIIHRCPTWAKSIREKKFCPHLVKLLLSIEPEKANNILSNIDLKLGDWKFESRLAVEFPK